ncbi:MAG: divalent-cation tolerance protein CutA [Planctomycetales bacterium]|nr:divalent-cation tolerance protein CutA [Planctomycetales bacterium]MBN8625142.1 divalent-cation tolerance protein CutA [Planctomycetota bacterium]
MSTHIFVVTTFSTRDEAESAAADLVDRRLVACAQVAGPVLSVYRWQGETERNDEYTLTLKTRADCYPAVEAALYELHSYDVPEIVALPLVAGHTDYLKWIDENVAG